MPSIAKAPGGGKGRSRLWRPAASPDRVRPPESGLKGGRVSAASMARPGGVPLRLAFAFFASGFGALLCQVVWQRMLGIFAGSDTVSAALVVGAFLAGLGVGSILGALVADRLKPRRALLGFALAEAGVAGFALLSKLFLYDFLASGLAGVIDAPAAIFALCFAGLLVPTTLMGVSLPLLARATATSLDRVAETIGRLYGLNTLGAGAGALIGGFVIVGTVGFVGALVVAAVFDLSAAILALTLADRVGDAALPAKEAKRDGGDGHGGVPVWCGLVFLSGYVIVGLEIVWVRLIGQIGQFHAYLFPTVIGVFLIADGLGIAVAARLVRGAIDPRRAFFLTQSAGFATAAALILLAWWVLPLSPLAPLLDVDRLRLEPSSVLATAALTLLLVAPPAFLIGMTFPFVQRAVQNDLASVGNRVGWVQLANIAGNAAGSLATGLVALHVLGTTGTLRFLALLSVGLLALSAVRARPRPAELAAALACVGAAVLVPENAAFWGRLHADGRGRIAALEEDRSGIAAFRDSHPANEVPDGPFFIQGFSQGRISFLEIHEFLGAVGPLIHPTPKDVLVIGVGTGGTPYAAGVSSATQHIGAVELVKPVLSILEPLAAEHRDGAIAAMLADSRYTLFYGDGRRTLAKSPAHYDVIEADAVLPEGSHAGLLYSSEFLQLVRSRLNPGGLYVQWAPTRRSVETFAAAFPYTLLLFPVNVLVGSDAPIPFDATRLAARFAEPAVAAYLKRGNPGFDAYGTMFREPPLSFTPEMSRLQAPLTDVFPRDEFYLNNPVEPAAAAAFGR